MNTLGIQRSTGRRRLPAAVVLWLREVSFQSTQIGSRECIEHDVEDIGPARRPF